MKVSYYSTAGKLDIKSGYRGATRGKACAKAYQ